MESVCHQIMRRGTLAQMDANAERFKLRLVGTHNVGVVGLAGDASGQGHLTANLRGRLEHDEVVAAPCRLDGTDEPSNARSDYGDALLSGHRKGPELGLARCAWIDQAAD